MTLISALKTIGMVLLDTLLPPHCLACDAPVPRDGQFCLPCFRTVNFVTAPVCARCGVPLPFSDAAGINGACGVCTAAPPAFGAARAALRYDAAARQLILPFKYADRTEAANGLAILMARAGAALLARADVLVPVPLHKTRLKSRRYNQSALLAAALGRIAGRPVLPDALVRLRATVPLGPLGLEARREQLAGAISLRGAAPHAGIRGRTVLLIDDVMTSGTTANACALALREGGATAVDVLVAARVPDPRQD